MVKEDNPQVKKMTQNEEKELLRVFNTLCNYLPKTKLLEKIKPLKERKNQLLNHKKAPESFNIFSNDIERKELSEEEIDQELEDLNKKIEDLEAELEEYDGDSERKIKTADLNECLKSLGKHCTKKEIEEMIWEVDENLDGMVDYEEFKLTFQRNISDTTGLEPFQLFNLIQFLMYDKDGSGQVSVDETMHMLYARHGKEELERQMKALFGEDLKTEDGDGELSFAEYLKAVSIRIPKSTKAKTLISNGKKSHRRNK